MIDPRAWKREHRLALIISLALGAVVGAALAYLTLGSPSRWYALSFALYCESRDRFCTYFSASYALAMFAWALAGAAVAGALVYVRQLLRS